MASDSMFMENLEEYIIDESRIVTYKWLSQTLSVHVNQAKQMLYSFVDDQRNKKQNDDLSVVYFVAGVKKLENGDVVHKCCVLPEEKLDSFKSALQSVTSCHVYSVQKSRLKDSNALYMSDYEKQPEDVSDYNKHGVIKCTSAVIRSDEELKKLRGLKKTEAPPSNTVQKTVNKPANGHGEGTKSKPAKKTGIAGMFAGAGKTTTTVKKDPETKSSDTKVSESKEKEKSPTTAVNKGKPQAAGGGMKSFFSKQLASNETKVKREEPKGKQTKEKTPPAEKRASKGKGKKSRPQDSDDEPRSKKRRRIRTDVFESSSEDEDVEIDAESPVPSPPRETTPPREDTPPPETKPPEVFVADTPTSNNNNNKSTEGRRKRTRKLVPKTFMDDDGYMVTEKVWESDSTDASEVEETETKKTKTSTLTTKNKDTVPIKKKAVQEKKPSPVKGNKQASLMSFFKKK